mgnify:CR=1 FL=1
MKVGDLVKWGWIDWPEMDEFGIGIVIQIEQDIVSTHVEIYANDKTHWYNSRELKTIRYTHK